MDLGKYSGFGVFVPPGIQLTNYQTMICTVDILLASGRFNGGALRETHSALDSNACLSLKNASENNSVLETVSLSLCAVAGTES